MNAQLPLLRYLYQQWNVNILVNLTYLPDFRVLFKNSN